MQYPHKIPNIQEWEHKLILNRHLQPTKTNLFLPYSPFFCSYSPKEHHMRSFIYNLHKIKISCQNFVVIISPQTFTGFPPFHSSIMKYIRLPTVSQSQMLKACRGDTYTEHIQFEMPWSLEPTSTHWKWVNPPNRNMDELLIKGVLDIKALL